VLPLREGGSLPGLVEADDLGTYVVKFRGAGQGHKALAAEVIVAQLAHAVGLRVPDLVTITIDDQLGRAEPDPEIQDLLRASRGLNLGVDYLPRSMGFDPAADSVAADLAATIVWFDALVLNVDRSWRNPNLLCWHGDLWLIDHGAALYFAHSWETSDRARSREYDHAAEHVLLPMASSIAAADERTADRLDGDVIAAAVATVPDDWLVPEPPFASADDVRRGYVDVLMGRLDNRSAWVPALEGHRVTV